MRVQRSVGSSVAMDAVLKHARDQFERTTAAISPFAEARSFSAGAYNAISAMVLADVIALVNQVQEMVADMPASGNLALLLYRELHTNCCSYYFGEYERVFRFRDSRPEQAAAIEKRSGFTASRLTWAASKIKGRTLRALQSLIQPSGHTVYFYGGTTFDWDDLTADIFTRGHRLRRLPMGPPLKIPLLDGQRALIAAWADQLHTKISDMLGTTTHLISPFDEKHYRRHVDALLARPAPVLEGCSLLVTGTLGREARLAAMRAAEASIPSATIYHGAHFDIFDEPYWPLYEGALADYICGYGDVARQKALGILHDRPSLSGNVVKYLSRTDSHLKSVTDNDRHKETIAAIGSLQNKTVVYIGVEFGGIRYGPFRDVHPSTYLAWQETLLAWLTKQSGRKPLVRLHPKRSSRRYDPEDYELLERSMGDALAAADVFVIDYPTTSLAYLAATDKPVLFTNLGFRRLHPMAMNVVSKRCHTAPIDILAPEQGLTALAEDFDRDCSDEFTSLFSWAPGGADETVAVASGIHQLLSP
jgi:hypothetical protein